jgi:hypothetical protein
MLLFVWSDIVLTTPKDGELRLFFSSQGKCMGRPIKSPQLKGVLLWFTPVEKLGEIP